MTNFSCNIKNIALLIEKYRLPGFSSAKKIERNSHGKCKQTSECTWMWRKFLSWFSFSVFSHILALIVRWYELERRTKMFGEMNVQLWLNCVDDKTWKNFYPPTTYKSQRMFRYWKISDFLKLFFSNVRAHLNIIQITRKLSYTQNEWKLCQFFRDPR